MANQEERPSRYTIHPAFTRTRIALASYEFISYSYATLLSGDRKFNSRETLDLEEGKYYVRV